MLVPSQPVGSEGFGASVGVSGDTLVVGTAARGEAFIYIYTWDGSSWVFQTRYTPPDLNADSFGGQLAIQGDLILVGAEDSSHPSPGNPFCHAGAAYLLRWNGLEVELVQTLFASDAGCLNGFGQAVALFDDTAAIGGRFGSSFTNSGAVHVFSETGGTWSERQKLEPSDPSQNSFFGKAMALDADHLLVGASLADGACPGNSSCSASGAVYDYRRVGNYWLELQKLTASDASGSALFGYSVALSQARLIVGAVGESSVVVAGGAAYAFDWSGTAWREEMKITVSASENPRQFGYAAALQDDHALLSSDGGPTGTLTGTVYVFSRRTAASTFRNAGSNPASYQCSTPIIGSQWQASVDLSTTDHSHAQVSGYLGSASALLAGGQTLLVGGGRVFRLPLALGPTAQWSVGIPNDPSLAGVTIYTQAARLLGVSPFALSNAQDLTMGF